MPITATNKKKERELVPEGAYSARIFQIIHIGTIAGYQGKMQNKARIAFELPTEMKVFDPAKGEQPQILSEEFNLSFNEKAALRKVIDACDPKGIKLDGEGFVEEYDITNLMGKECLITVKHEPKKDGSGMFEKIDNYTVLPKGMKCPPPVNPQKTLTYDDFDTELYASLPDFLKDKIKSSSEYQAMVNGESYERGDDPFEMNDDESPI